MNYGDFISPWLWLLAVWRPYHMVPHSRVSLGYKISVITLYGVISRLGSGPGNHGVCLTLSIYGVS